MEILAPTRFSAIEYAKDCRYHACGWHGCRTASFTNDAKEGTQMTTDLWLELAVILVRVVAAVFSR